MDLNKWRNNNNIGNMNKQQFIPPQPSSLSEYQVDSNYSSGIQNNYAKKQQQQQQQQQSALDQSHMTRDQSIYLASNYFCEEHPNEPITNYCSSLDCLKPLCPECIDQHYKLHLQQSTIPEIESIKNVKNNCSKKLKAAIISLTSEMEKAELQYLINPEQIIEDGQLRIRKCREKVQQVINSFFETLEDTFKKRVHENMLKATDFNLVFDKIKALIQELELLNQNLDSGSTINVIKKICLLDLKSLMDKFRSEIHRVIDSRDLDPVGIQFEEIRINSLKAELDKIVQVVKITSEYHEGHELPVLTNQGRDFQLFANPTPSKQYNQQFMQQGQPQGFANQVQLQQQQQPQPPTNQIALQQQKPGHPANNNAQNQQNFPLQQQQQQPQQAIIQQQPQPQFLLSPQTATQSKNLIIQQPDYYEQSCQQKFMHFFLNEDKVSKLFYFSLPPASSTVNSNNNLLLNNNNDAQSFSPTKQQQQQLSSNSNKAQGKQNVFFFEVLELQINFQMPFFHKSISLPNGEIYMTGGRRADGQKSDEIFQLDFSSLSLRPVAKMNVPRSSHGICYARQQVFLVGGFTNNQKMTDSCEVFDPVSNKCTLIDSLNSPASSLCLTPFNDKYIFKFGGIGDNRQLSLYIEKYDIDNDKWTVIDPKISPNDSPATFSLLSTACCLQINNDDIFVFGGYTEQNIGSKLSYVLHVEDPVNDQYIIRSINWKSLPVAEGFWNNFALIHDGSVFALQNVPCVNSNNCLENDRKILQFNGKEWKILNNNNNNGNSSSNLQ